MLASWEIRVLAQGEEAPEGKFTPFFSEQKRICFLLLLNCFLEEAKKSSSSSSSSDEGDGNVEEKPAEVPEPEPEPEVQAQPVQVEEQQPAETQGLL